jgi:hypothetical protein
MKTKRKRRYFKPTKKFWDECAPLYKDPSNPFLGLIHISGSVAVRNVFAHRREIGNPLEDVLHGFMKDNYEEITEAEAALLFGQL